MVAWLFFTKILKRIRLLTSPEAALNSELNSV
jgi:hypothetical protein